MLIAESCQLLIIHVFDHGVAELGTLERVVFRS